MTTPSQLRQTHTVVVLGISQAAFDEISAKLRAAGYDHVFMPDGEIDMSGIAVAADASAGANVTAPAPGVPFDECCPRCLRDGMVERASECKAHGVGMIPVAAPMYRKCLYCTRDMLAGSECQSEARADKCDVLAGAVAPSDGGEAAMKPIDMILYCPNCGVQHVDAPEAPRMEQVASRFAQMHSFQLAPTWDNPPHKSHLCHGCGCIWRPADVATNGVAELKTTGKDDTWPAIHNEEVHAARGVQGTLKENGND